MMRLNSNSHIYNISIPSLLTEELLTLGEDASNLKYSGSKGDEAAERQGEAIRLSRGREPFVFILKRWENVQ